VNFFCGDDLLVKEQTVPRLSEVSELIDGSGINSMSGGSYFGTVNGTGCIAFNMPAGFNSAEFTASAADGGSSQQFVLLRRYVGELDDFINSAAGYASHMLHWDRHSRYCGRCGTENGWHPKERAKLCPSCGSLQFPRISPAIIIMIQKEGEVLLAHNCRFPEGRYSLLAGFMEMGETIEQTAAREVREEVGIEIGNIRYIASQSWPFPDSLMLGLSAEYRSGDIKPDGIEITDAGWFNPDSFPSIPGHGTIARKLIDEYTKTYKS